MIRKTLSILVFLCAGLLSNAFASDLVNINSADAKTIEEKLIGIGAVKAHAIVEYREKNGPFKTVDELLEVSGIGEKTLSKIRAEITASVSDGAEY